MFEDVDVVCNNAGVCLTGSYAATTAEDFRSQMDVVRSLETLDRTPNNISSWAMATAPFREHLKPAGGNTALRTRSRAGRALRRTSSGRWR